MKDAIDSIPAEHVVEDGFANRKLIRPSLNRNDSFSRNDSFIRNDHNHSGQSSDRRPDRGERNGGGRKSAPVETTNAENFYYQKQMQSKTPMVIVLRDGEQVHGVIEWYDKSCLKVNRTGAPNLMIYKPAIKYMFKEGENVKK
ncbi:MAG TPA: RNA chaperone Hfq [Terriglobales bacterium]|nr:RNA chaperone Hfq [Terriglobales bacterium]